MRLSKSHFRRCPCHVESLWKTRPNLEELKLPGTQARNILGSGFLWEIWSEENQHEAQLALEGQALRSRRETGKAACAAVSECGKTMGENFKDIREHLAALEQAGKLIKITRAINKDTELMPLVRWQFRGLPESERKAFLFTNVVDVTGRKYDMPVAVGCSGGIQGDVCSRVSVACGPDR